MLQINEKESDDKRVPTSAKIKESNKMFIMLLQDSLNDILNELNENNLNYTETLEHLIEIFSKDNPYILEINKINNSEDCFNLTETLNYKYTVKEVVDRYIEKYAIQKIRNFFDNSKINNNILIDILDYIMFEILEEEIQKLNNDLDMIQDEIGNIDLEKQYLNSEEIKGNLFGAYSYLDNAIKSSYTDQFEEFTMCSIKEIENEFKNRVLEHFNINNISAYYKFHEKNEEIKINLLIISKLLKLYIYKIEKFYQRTAFDKPIYNNELEKFLDGEYDVKINIGNRNIDPLNFNIG